MSSTAMMDSYDTPMFDFSDDTDISMGTTAVENWFHPPSRMEEDGQMPHGFEQDGGVEVDMMAYEETAEYEMADEEAEQQDHAESDQQDADVYDVSIAASPAPHSDRTLEHPFEEQITAEIVSDSIIPSTAIDSHHIISPHVVEHAQPSDALGTEASKTPLSASESLVLPMEKLPPTDRQLSIIEGPPDGQEAFDSSGEQNKIKPAGQHGENPSDHREDEVLEQPQLGPSDPSEFTEASGLLVASEEADETGENQEHQNQNPGVPAEISDNRETSYETNPDPQMGFESSYTDLPPPVLLSLRLTSLEGEQPEFTLFSPPETGPANEKTDSEHPYPSPSEEPLVLLQHRPTLYYEPMSAVFEALRQEEYFSHLEELVDAEMALDAFDIQLVVSEDNVYAREVSLHDLNAIHDGIGLTGPLRVTLQSVVPRFITRYNVLRDQITRLTLSGDADEEELGGEEDAEGEDEYPEGSEQAVENATDQPNYVAQTEFEDSRRLQGHDIPEQLDDPERVETEEQSETTVPVQGDSSSQRAQDESSDHTLDGDELHTQADEDDPTSYDDNDDIRDDTEAPDGQTLNEDNIHPVVDVPQVSENEYDEGAAEHFEPAENHEDGEQLYDDEYANDGAEASGTTEEAEEAAYDEPEDSDTVRENRNNSPALDAESAALEDNVTAPSEVPDSSHRTNHHYESHDVTPSSPSPVGHSTDHYSKHGNEKSERKDNAGSVLEIGEDSLEETFSESPEEVDAASEAALLESEKFLEMLDKENSATESSLNPREEGEINEKQAKQPEITDEHLIGKNGLTGNDAATSMDNSKRRLAAKPSKRSLDQADLDEQSDGSPPGSPGSKRVRVL